MIKQNWKIHASLNELSHLLIIKYNCKEPKTSSNLTVCFIKKGSKLQRFKGLSSECGWLFCKSQGESPVLLIPSTVLFLLH